MSDRIRAEWATRDLYRSASELSAEIRKRRAAEAERDEWMAYAGVLEALLEAAEARVGQIATESLGTSQCGCFEGLLP